MDVLDLWKGQGDEVWRGLEPLASATGFRMLTPALQKVDSESGRAVCKARMQAAKKQIRRILRQLMCSS